MSSSRPEAGVKLRDDEKVKHIPVTIIPTEKEAMLRKPEWIKIKLPRTTEKVEKIKQTSPVAQWVCALLGIHVELPVLHTDVLMELTLAMLGLAGLRSWEKSKGLTK